MLKKPAIALTLALLIAVGFCAGLGRLFALRYEAGEVYPPYSTMRADPLGAKGLLEALATLPDVEVRRNFLPLKKLQPGRPVTLVYLGTSHQSYWTERELEEFETLVFGGGRVVISFFPFDRPPGVNEARHERDAERDKKRQRIEDEKEESKKKAKDEKQQSDMKQDGKSQPDQKTDAKKESKGKDDDEDENDREKSGLISFEDFGKRYGFHFDYLRAEQGKTFARHAFLFEAGARLETDLSWHSALYFKDLAPEWKPIYLSENQPVLIERSYGRGSIVLAADSYFFSNEALRRERHPQLLARIFDGPPLIVFDEEHLGVTDETGIVQLALKYRLHGVIAGLVLLAALFVWKNTTRFVPAYLDGGRDGALVAGRDASQGFTNLLYRAIKPADLLATCVAEWRRTFSRHPAASRVVEILAREQSRPPKQRNPVAAYREIHRTLARRSTPSNP